MLGPKSRQCGVKYWNNREKPVFTLLSRFSDILGMKSKLTIVFSTPFYMYMWLSSAHKIASIYSCSRCEKTVESQLNWLIVPKCGCRIGSLFAIDHIGYDGVAIRRGVLGVWTCISTMRQVIVFKCEVFVWFNWNKLCDIFFGGRAFSQTDKITCEYSLFVLHPEHSHCFFRWESACWWARSVTWEIYDLHPSQESIKEKITLTSSKVCLNTTYEGNHTYSSTTILTECVLNVCPIIFYEK